MTQIGFIGLGHMGKPMVKNLLQAGYDVLVYDINRSAMDELVTIGAQCASCLSDLASQSDIIITMLQTGEQVQSICLASDGLFPHAKKNVLYIDSSSIDIQVTRFLHESAKKYNIAMLDAPVSGGVAGAEAAALTFMVGGSEKNLKKAMPILSALGKKIVHAGDPGNGQAAKICNNLILGICMIAVSEGFTLGKKLGLDPSKFFEISSNASSQCWSITNYCPVPGLVASAPSSKGFKPGFTAKMMLKDLRLAQKAAEMGEAIIPLGAESAELYSLFIQQGHGDLDFSGIINLFAGTIFDEA